MHNHAARQLKLSASSPALATYLFCHLTYVGVAALLSLSAANDIGTHTQSIYATICGTCILVNPSKSFDGLEGNNNKKGSHISSAPRNSQVTLALPGNISKEQGSL